MGTSGLIELYDMATLTDDVAERAQVLHDEIHEFLEKLEHEKDEKAILATVTLGRHRARLLSQVLAQVIDDMIEELHQIENTIKAELPQH